MDSLRSIAIRAAANQHELVQRFGRVQSIEVDPSTKQIFLSLLLTGEIEPLQATLRYEQADTAEGKEVRIVQAEISRAWLNELAQFILEKQGPARIPLQGSSGKIISMIL